MRWPEILRTRLRWLLLRRDFERQLAADLEFHIEQATAELVERGLTPQEARRAAMRDFGSTQSVAEEVRAVSLVMWWERLVQDVRYALRSYRRSPAFAAAAVLSLALGIGANTAIFSLVDAVLLRSLPVWRPHELVFLQVAGSDSRGGAPPYPCFERIRDRTAAFAGISAFASDELRLTVDGRIEQVFGQVASGSYFDLLGLRPAAGRLFTHDDEKLDPPVAVISHGYWQRRFGGAPDALGKTIVFRNRSFTIVGVTPAGFSGLQPGRQIEVSLPITQDAGSLASADTWWFEAIARLRPGATVDQARSQADTVFQSFMKDLGKSAESRRRRFDRIELAAASRGLDRLRARFSTPLLALTLVAGIVLLIACVNLANLLLARGAARAREFAIRLATGAGASRLLRQLLTETLLLFVLGALAGLLLANAAIQALLGFFAIGRNPIRLDVPFDWRLAAFALGIALAAGLLTGLWPALRALRTDPHAAMKEGEARVAGSRRSRAVSRVLVAGQVALSVVLLVGAAMFAKTMDNLRAVELGFSGTRVLTMSLDPLLPPDAAAGARERFWREVLERVRALPGVRAASLSVLSPLSGRDTGKRVGIAGYRPHSEPEGMVRLNHVSEDYFRTFGIALRRGRDFTRDDALEAPKVAVVNETAARVYFGGRDPLGETIDFGQGRSYTVVGVARDHKHRSLREPPQRIAFVPVWQRLDPIGRITLGVASDRAAPILARAVAGAVQAVHANTLVSDVIGVEEQIDATLLSERLLSKLAGAFAALALLLAAVGLYGVLSYSVARRSGELGIRLALGAPRARLASDVVRDVLLQVSAGVALGLPAALALVRAAEGMLFGVAPAEPGLYAPSITALAAVACVAAWLPVRRACAIDPAETLRRA
jgi:predicted permease